MYGLLLLHLILSFVGLFASFSGKQQGYSYIFEKSWAQYLRAFSFISFLACAGILILTLPEFNALTEADP